MHHISGSAQIYGGNFNMFLIRKFELTRKAKIWSLVDTEIDLFVYKHNNFVLINI